MYFIRKSRLKFAEICEISKEIEIILCVETSGNTIQFYVLKLFQQKEKTCTSYSKMFNANDSSMNGTCNTYVQCSAQKT